MECLKVVKKLWVGVILLQVVFGADPAYFCSYRCENREIHTLCKFQGPSTFCREFVHLNYMKEKLKVLKYHNQLRNAFAGATANYHHPPAANMMLLYWDGELEISALRWAQQCSASSKERDSCRDVPRFKVGQSIAVIEGSDFMTLKRLPVHLLFRQWADQWGSMQVSTIARYTKTGPEVSELSQALWATTTRIGCADVIYSITEGKFVRLLVCNYGPAGNILGRPVYTMGKPCSDCPEGSDCIFGRLPNLCVGPKNK